MAETVLKPGDCLLASKYGVITAYSIKSVNEIDIHVDSVYFSRESLFWEFDDEVPMELLTDCVPAPPDLCEQLVTLCEECRAEVKVLVEKCRGKNVTKFEYGKTYGCSDDVLFTLLPPLLGDEDEAMLHFYDEGQITISHDWEPLFDTAGTTCFLVADDTLTKMSKIVRYYIGKAWQLCFPHL